MKRLWGVLAQDIKWGYRQWVVISIAGSRLVPRPLRHVIYRMMKVRLDTVNVFAGVKITGGSRLAIGSGTFVNHDCYFEAAGGITVGKDCAFGPGVMVLTNTHDVHGTTWQWHSIQQPVSIGDNCWIGARATILPGVTIASGSIVASGAVVANDCAEPGIWGGVPARLLRSFAPV